MTSRQAEKACEASLKANPKTVLVFTVDSASSSAIREVDQGRRRLIDSSSRVATASESQAADLSQIINVRGRRRVHADAADPQGDRHGGRPGSGTETCRAWSSFGSTSRSRRGHSGRDEGASSCKRKNEPRKRGKRRRSRPAARSRPGGNSAIAGRLGVVWRSEIDGRASVPIRRAGTATTFDALIAQALAEDLGQMGDITSTATIPSHARGAARLVARSPGVLAGLTVVERLVAEFELVDNWEPLSGRRRSPRAGQPDRARAAGRCVPCWRWSESPSTFSSG